MTTTSTSSSSEYEIRKAMLSVMTDRDIEAVIKDKEYEARLTRIPAVTERALKNVSTALSLSLEFVRSSYVSELNSDINSAIADLKRELKMRRSPESVIDLKELKAMVPIANVVRHYVPSYGM